MLFFGGSLASWVNRMYAERFFQIRYSVDLAALALSFTCALKDQTPYSNLNTSAWLISTFMMMRNDEHFRSKAYSAFKTLQTLVTSNSLMLTSSSCIERCMQADQNFKNASLFCAICQQSRASDYNLDSLSTSRSSSRQHFCCRSGKWKVSCFQYISQRGPFHGCASRIRDVWLKYSEPQSLKILEKQQYACNLQRFPWDHWKFAD